VVRLGQGVLVCLAALALRKPEAETLAIPERLPHALHDHTPGEVLRSPLFWVLFVMSLLVTAAGLTFTANLAGIARSLGVADMPVSMLGFTLPALTFALTFDRVTNGIARPLCGWLSDYIGRENTMFFAFTMGALSILAFARWGDEPVMFVLLVSLVFFAWGEVASLFPATCTDYFGSGYATTNAGMLHTAKGFAAMLVPLADPLVRATGDWQIVFGLAVGANAVAAILASPCCGRCGRPGCGGHKGAGVMVTGGHRLAARAVVVGAELRGWRQRPLSRPSSIRSSCSRGTNCQTRRARAREWRRICRCTSSSKAENWPLRR
jgi:OFA family oxalate/formate antiporter-like MFS transporter